MISGRHLGDTGNRLTDLIGDNRGKRGRTEGSADILNNARSDARLRNLVSLLTFFDGKRAAISYAH